MCASHEPTDPGAGQPFGPNYFVANLRQPGPLGWKLRGLWTNSLIKLTKRQHCCGHAGEPGC